MASDLSSGCTETIDILDDEKEEGEISLEDVSSSEEGGVGHLTSSYVISRKRRSCAGCKSTWSECASWCSAAYRSKSQSKRDPRKGKENRHHIKEAGCAIMKHTSMLQEKNDDLVPISSDSDMEIVGLTDTSNRSKAKTKKKKSYDVLSSSIDELISPASVDLTDFTTLKTHYRELSPAHRSIRSRVIPKSPIRKYRSSVRSARSPVFRSSHSPLSYPKSSTMQRSPRRLRSPKQSSPYHSTVRTISRKPARPESPLVSSPATARFHRYGTAVTRLLKKVKRLDSVGVHTSESNISRGKQHHPSSLKEKIFNMLRKIPDNKDDIMHLKEKSKVADDAINDADDEEDLALLRQKALETKQKKSSRLLDCPTVDLESEKKDIAEDDDQDVEALQLRMIALRSAVMKKHQDRVQRGIRTNKNRKRPTRSESPFNQSFLDDIPVPSDELLNFASPPCTPPHASHLTDSNNAEDMEIDTDVEREKEKLPYSPTDKITLEIPVDTAMLGIEPSDVSFINVNETASSPVFDDDEKRNEETSLSTGVSPYYDNTYLVRTYDPLEGCVYPPLSRRNSGIFQSDNIQDHLRHYNSDNVECNLLDGICCRSEMYRTDTVLMHRELDMTRPLPAIDAGAASCTLPNSALSPMEQVTERSNDGVQSFANTSTIFRDEVRMNAAYYGINTTRTFIESVSPNGSMITVDDLAEIDVESAGDDRNLFVVDCSPQEATPCQGEIGTTLETSKEEPLYMQDAPGITKHLNMIPTLINRTLVPASILKSNKLLRQRLPKRREVHPSFKSAEMQPVIVDTSVKSDCSFKPIKLQPPRKPAPVLTAPIVFDNPNENSENDLSENRDDTAPAKNETTDPIDNTAADDEAASARKKRKRIKKSKRKSLSSAQPLGEKRDNSGTKDDKDVGIVAVSVSGKQTAESHRNNKSNDENKAQGHPTDNGEPWNLQSAKCNTREPLSDNSNNVAMENKDAHKTEQHTSPGNEGQISPGFIKRLQEKNTISYMPANIVSALDSHPALHPVEMAKDNAAADRRQSVDEDEDELRAILLASLVKRSTKTPDTNDNPAVVPAATNLVATNTRTTTPKPLANVSVAAGVKLIAADSAPLVSTKPSPSEPKSIGVKVIGADSAPLVSTKPSPSDIGEKKRITASAINSYRKRINSGATTNLAKKMPKKTPIPASTKVVNNAKKYQNMIVQRKLNLLKTDNVAACNSSAKPNEKVWSNVQNQLKTLHVSDTQRFVINLGSDTDSESENERCRPIASTAEKPQPDMSADFEKSLQKFLRDMRKEQEQSVATVKPSIPQAAVSSTAKRDASPAAQADPKKSSSNMHTPLAVRHLPASQQQEYHRLKQQILEREKLKLQKKIADSSGDNNKLLDAKKGTAVMGSLTKSLSEKRSMNVKSNLVKSRGSEGNSQESPSHQIKKKNADEVISDMSVLNAIRASASKSHSANVAKHTNPAQANLQIKGIKRIITNNLSIRITNEKITPSHTSIGSKIVDGSSEKHSVNDKQQHSKPTLRTLSKEEVNRKYVQVQLKSKAIGRVVTINDKAPVQRDTTSQRETPRDDVIHDVSVEILEEKIRNESNNSGSTFFDMSTVILPNECSSLSVSKQELDTTIETTMSRSQYAAEHQQEINRNSIMPSAEDGDGNGNDAPHKSNVGDKNNTDDIWDALKKDVKVELDSLTSLSETEQQRYLRDTEHKLITKRCIVLDHLADMSVNLRQWDMEKDLQSSLAAEVKKLKDQLMLVEERLQVQRNRVNSMGPKVSTARQKINVERRECFKLSKICSSLGNRLMGKSYKLPEAGGQLLSDKLKEVANHTRHFSKKRRIHFNDVPESCTCPRSSKQVTELSKITCAKEDLSLQEQPRNGTADMMVTDVIDVTGSKSDTSCLTQSNDSENFLALESSLDSPQASSNQITVKMKDKLANTLEFHSNEQITPPNQHNVSLSIPQLNSTPIERNSEQKDTERNHSVNISDPITPSTSQSLATNLFLRNDDEQRDDKETSSRPSIATTAHTTTSTMTTTGTTTTMMTGTTTTTMMTTTTTTMTTMTRTMTMMMTTTPTMMKTIVPYVSILTHLKTPRTTNPHGILCPYEIMGICRDEDCQFIHQSRHET